MEFKRIDNETVRCIINEEDMKEYNIEIDDFLKNRGKIQEFLHQIVERAVDEVGYNPKNGMLAMQVMPLPRNRIAITFSEKSSIGMEDIIQQVNEVLGSNGDINPEEMMHQFDDMSNEEKAEIFDKFIKNTIQDAAEEIEEDKYRNSLEKEKSVKKKNEDKVEHHIETKLAVFRFQTFEALEQFSQVIPQRLPMKSTLYKQDSVSNYYLVLNKARSSDDNYKKVLERAMEFGIFDSNQNARVAFLKEHCSCLIADKAMRVIAKLNQ